MQEVTLELEKREVTGKTVKKLRQAGYIPAVIHDHGKPSIVVQGEYQAMFKAYQDAGRHTPIHVKAGDKKYITIVKSVTIDPRYNSISHIVFNAVKAHEKVITEVPVRMKLAEGNDATPAERASLMVINNLTSVEIEAPANKLPEALEFDGEKLVEVGDHITVANLVVPAGVEIKTDPTQTIAQVLEPSAVAAANDAAGGTEAETPAEATEASEGLGGAEVEAAEA